MRFFRLVASAGLMLSLSTELHGFSSHSLVDDIRERILSANCNLQNRSLAAIEWYFPFLTRLFAKTLSISPPRYSRQVHVFSTNTAPVDPVIRPDQPKLTPKELRSLRMNEMVNVGLFLVAGLSLIYSLTTMESNISRGWTSGEIVSRIPIDVWSAYSGVLQASPIATKAVTSATVYSIGDFLAQRTEGVSIGQLDRPRLLRSCIAGLVGHGPLSHLWYNVCDGIFNNVFHLTVWWSFIPKVLVDQSIWGPIWNNTYILLIGLMKLENPEKILADMKRTTIPLIVSGLKLWPLAHCVTYGLIPVENRLLWVDLVEIAWVTILASTAATLTTDENKQSTNETR